jgi:NAD(P)-dependent dehydrogenase (short-subunit alcohol dehydrogenase family)
MTNIILFTGASSGFGRLTADALAKAGHIVYASMRDVAGTNAKNAADMAAIPNTDIRPIELDVQSEDSVNAAVGKIISEPDRRAGPQCRSHEVWAGRELHRRAVRAAVRRECTRNPTRQPRRAAAHAQDQAGPARLGIELERCRRHAALPYFAAKAAMDMLAVHYARELARWGIETSIIVPGAFTKGTNHFANAGHPADAARLAELRQHRPRRRGRSGRDRCDRRNREHAVRQAPVPRHLRSDP